MNISDVFDWAYFWTMFRNFMVSGGMFVMIPIAIYCMGLLLTMIIQAVRGSRSG